MGNTQSVDNISFFELSKIVLDANSNNDYVIINTLPPDKQTCLIKNTIDINSEVDCINNLINNINNKTKTIIIYGSNYRDKSIYTKYNQLIKLKLKPTIYMGGIFEWLCLQELYGSDTFPTTSRPVGNLLIYVE